MFIKLLLLNSFRPFEFIEIVNERSDMHLAKLVSLTHNFEFVLFSESTNSAVQLCV